MHAQPDEQPSIDRVASTLTPAQEKEMRRMDPNGDGIIDKKEARAIARSTAELRASNSRLWKIVFGVVALLFLSWLGNAGLMTAVVFLSKDLKVEGSSLKNMNGDSVSTANQKNVYEVTLLSSSSRRQLHEERSTSTTYNASVVDSVVAQVACSSVLKAIASIEQGNDGSLVKIALGNGEFWEPRMSAAYYHLHNDSFGIEHIYLDGRHDVSYDVTCEVPKADCENAPGTLCDAVAWEVSFDGAFDGDIPSRRRRRLSPCKNGAESHWHLYIYGQIWHNCD